MRGSDFFYFDNAATGFPKSKGVFEAIREAYYGTANAGRSGHPLAIAAAAKVYECRERLAAAFGSESENVVLCPGATYALNMAIKGLAVPKSDIVTSVMEHNAVLRPLYALSSNQNRLNFFSPSFDDKAKTLKSFENAITADTRLVVLTHASNVCGGMIPIKEISETAHKVGAVLIADCSQSAGHMPIDIKKLGADVICFAGHKGLYGPLGTGAMIINPDSRLHFGTIIEGGTGMASRDRVMPRILPERLEAGTLNVMGFAGLSQAVFELEYGIEREREIQSYLVSGLKRINGVKLYSEPLDFENFMPLILFNKASFTAETVAERLSEQGICVRGGLHCAPLAHSALGSGRNGGVRISVGRANTKEQADRILETVEAIA